MRLIDAEKFEEFTRKNCSDSLVDLWLELVRRQPTIDAAPVVHGFNDNRNFHEVDEFCCSECGLHLEGWSRRVYDEENDDTFWVEYVFKHCPECGAKIDIAICDNKMDGGAEC